MELLLYTGFFAPLLPILFFLLFKRKSQEKSVWVIFFYILYCTINEILNRYLQQIDSEYVLQLFNVFTILEFSFISYYFLLIFKNQAKTQNIIKILWIIFTLYVISNIFLNKWPKSWDSIAIGVESLIIIILSVYYIFVQIKRTNSLSIYTKFHFWIAVTFVVYFSGTFFLNIMAESMRKNRDYQMLYIYINIGSILIKNILLAVAMTMNVPKLEHTTLPELDDHLFLKNA